MSKLLRAPALAVLIVIAMLAGACRSTDAPPSEPTAPDSVAEDGTGDGDALAEDAGSVDEGGETADDSGDDVSGEDSAEDSDAGEGALTFLVDADASEASYAVREEFFAGALGQLGIQPGVVETVGTTGDVQGELVILPEDPPRLVSGRVVVGVGLLSSDQERRDNRVAERSLQTEQFPEAVFEIRAMEGFPTGYQGGETAAFQLVGDLTVRDVTRSVTFDAEAVYDGNGIEANAEATVRMSDFGIQPPSFANMFDVADEVSLRIRIVAPVAESTQGAAPSTGAGGAVAGDGGGSLDDGEKTSAVGGRADERSAVLAEADAAATTAALAASTGCPATAPDGMGPFYVPDAPERDEVGAGYTLTGVVRETGSCAPISSAKIEMWMAGPDGEYGDAWRATLFSDESGLYHFASIPPTPYTGRPPHIHVRVTAPDYQELVTHHYPAEGSADATMDLVLMP